MEGARSGAPGKAKVPGGTATAQGTRAGDPQALNLTQWTRPVILVLLSTADLGTERMFDVARHLYSTLQRQFRIVVTDIPDNAAHVWWDTFMHKVQYAQAIIAVGARGGLLDGYTKELGAELGSRPVVFVSTISSLCCDAVVLQASCRLMDARNYFEGDIHVLDKNLESDGEFRPNLFDRVLRQSCADVDAPMGETHQTLPGRLHPANFSQCERACNDPAGQPGASLLGIDGPGIQRAMPPLSPPATSLPETGATDSEWLRFSSDNFGQNRKRRSGLHFTDQARPTDWVVMQSVSCCNMEGQLLFHSSLLSALSWTRCADKEGDTCACTGKVVFGRKFVSGKPGAGALTSAAQLMSQAFREKAVSGSVTCSFVAMGGDPLPGIYKYLTNMKTKVFDVQKERTSQVYVILYQALLLSSD